MPRTATFADRLTLERPSTIPDGMGGFADAWTVVATDIASSVWADAGGESVRAARLSSVANVSIIIRKTTAFTIAASDRLRNARTGEVYAVKWAGALEQDRRHILIAATIGDVADE